MSARPRQGGGVLSVGEAAARLGVAARTVQRWEAAGLIEATRTPAGHRRYKAEDVEALLTTLPAGERQSAVNPGLTGNRTGGGSPDVSP